MNASSDRNSTNWASKRIEEAGLNVNFEQSGCPFNCQACYAGEAALGTGGFGEIKCSVCVPNSSLNTAGICVCEDGWLGRDCNFFNGICSYLCTGCFGPTAHHCVKCGVGSGRDESGACSCISPSKESYIAASPCTWNVDTCAEACETCKFEEDGYMCDACFDNAARNEWGKCECLPNWTGHDCSLWQGSCAPACMVCISYDQCLSCMPHAARTEFACACEIGWDVLADCSAYDSVCDARCEACVGPDNTDCI
jgi:hypothetical protein